MSPGRGAVPACETRIRLVLLRMAIARLVRHWNAKGQLDRRAVVVGGGAPASGVIEALDSAPDIDVTIAGIFDDRSDDRSPPIVSGYRKLGNVSELIDFVRRHRVDLLIITLPLTAESRLLDMLKRLWVLPVDIRLSAYTQKMRYRPRAYSYIGNVPFLVRKIVEVEIPLQMISHPIGS